MEPDGCIMNGNIGEWTIKTNRTLCCSDKCEKRFKCARADINNVGVYCVENFYSFGSGTFDSNGCQIEYWCGELGNYKMFEPIEKETEETIPFPFQF